MTIPDDHLQSREGIDKSKKPPHEPVQVSGRSLKSLDDIPATTRDPGIVNLECLEGTGKLTTPPHDINSVSGPSHINRNVVPTTNSQLSESIESPHTTDPEVIDVDDDTITNPIYSSLRNRRFHRSAWSNSLRYHPREVDYSTPDEIIEFPPWKGEPTDRELYEFFTSKSQVPYLYLVVRRSDPEYFDDMDQAYTKGDFLRANRLRDELEQMRVLERRLSARLKLVRTYSDNLAQREADFACTGDVSLVRRTCTLAQIPSSLRFPDSGDRDVYAFQRDGAAWLLDRLIRGRGSILADEMGVGKTIQVCLTLLGARSFIKTVLLVSPKGLLSTWNGYLDSALHDHFTLKHGLDDDFHGPAVYTINYESLHKVRGRVWDVIICDEAHYLKKRSGKTHGLVNQLSCTRGKILVTGTPVMNSIEEVHPLLCLALGRYFGYPTVKVLKKVCGLYDSPLRGKHRRREFPHKIRLDEYHRELTRICRRHILRRYKTDIPELVTLLPRKTEYIVLLSPSTDLQQHYLELENEIEESDQILPSLNKLRVACLLQNDDNDKKLQSVNK